MSQDNKGKTNVPAVKQQESTAITGIEDGGLPDYMQGDKGKGGLESGTGDMVLSRLNLLQALSPEVSSGLFKAGEIINNVSLVSYKDKLQFIPLFDSREAVKWVPKERGKIECMSIDCVNGSKYGACAACKTSYNAWRDDTLSTDERKNLCVSYLNFPSIVNGEDLPTIISFEKTKYKVGSQLKNLYINLCSKAHTTIPMYAFKFELGITSQTNNSGTFFNYTIKHVGYSSKEEYAMCKKWYDTLKATQYKAEYTQPESK